MVWICPTCDRQFASANQWHSCGRFEISDHFVGRPQEMVAIYQALIQASSSCGENVIEATKSAILVKRRVTFLAIRLRKSYVAVEFRLERELTSDKIVKVVQLSPGAYYYHVKVRSLEDIDDSLEKWLCEAWGDVE